MTGLRRFLRRLLVWWLPGLAMLAVLACSFVFWLLASQTGTRLLLTTAAQQLDGQALDVRGSILRGLEVGRLDLDVGGTRIGISDLRLTVRWRALGDRLLHVRELAAGSVEVALATSGKRLPTPATTNLSHCPPCRWRSPSTGWRWANSTCCRMASRCRSNSAT